MDGFSVTTTFGDSIFFAGVAILGAYAPRDEDACATLCATVDARRSSVGSGPFGSGFSFSSE